MDNFEHISQLFLVFLWLPFLLAWSVPMCNPKQFDIFKKWRWMLQISTILAKIFWQFTAFLYSFDSPQEKWHLIHSIVNFIHDCLTSCRMRDLSKQFWCKVDGTKNLISQLSFQTQSSYNSILKHIKIDQWRTCIQNNFLNRLFLPYAKSLFKKIHY